MAQMILVNVERKIGRLNHEDIYDVTWLDPETMQIWMTIVDSSYRNFTRSNWDRIVTGDIIYGEYRGLIRTARVNRDGLPVISADSHPQLVTPMTLREVEQVVDVLKEQAGLA
jgi:hypothetical protein